MNSFNFSLQIENENKEMLLHCSRLLCILCILEKGDVILFNF
jgi:hypothetical protein